MIFLGFHVESLYGDNTNLVDKNLRLSKISGPIYINDADPSFNWSIAEGAGICTGNGTYSNPYIIEDFLIDGGGSVNCIVIENSNVYFRIENCTLYNSVSTPENSGILLKQTNNGKLINNNCSFNKFGITFDSNCEYITIQGNFINDNTDSGMNLMESSYIDIRENTVNNNGIMGINLEPESSYNQIVDNTVNFNGWLGIHLQNNSTHNLLISNNCSYNGEGISVRAPNNTISDNYIEYNSVYGIHFWKADDYNNTQYNNITRNFIQYNQNGILFSDNSSYNIIEGNRIIDNAEVGFWIQFSSHNNVINNNTFINNLDTNAKDDGINNQWDNGTIGNSWSDYLGKDANDDGIGDTNYGISGAAGSQDNYPIFWDAPIVSIIDPIANKTFSTVAPEYNISIEGVPLAMWYTVEGVGGTFNITELTGEINQTIWKSLTEGEIVITFYAQDSRDEIGSNSVTVVKSIPEGIPGYNLFILLGVLSILIIVINKKIKK